MIQVIEQTHEEKLAMYMKLPKKQVVEMLIECNRIIRAITPTVYYRDGWKLKTKGNVLTNN